MLIQLGELAQAIDARLEGDASIEVSKLSEIQFASSSEISFLSNSKYLKYVSTCKAAALIIPDDMELDYPNLLRSANPKQSMQMALKLLNHHARTAQPGIHPSAQIAEDVNVPDSCELGPGVVIGSGVTLGEYVILESNVVLQMRSKIGDQCHLHPGVVIYEDCQLGKKCIIHSGSIIGSDGFGFVIEDGEIHKIPQTGNAILGDSVEVGANCAIDRGSIGPTTIGSGTKLDNLVHIAHNVHIGKNCFLTAQIGIAGSTTMGDRVQMGGQSGVVGHLSIGNDVSIATRGGVTRDIPDGMMVSGFPARPHRNELKIEAVIQKLPELYKAVKTLEKQVNKT